MPEAGLKRPTLLIFVEAWPVIFHSTGQKINEILSELHQQNFISSKQLLYLKPPLEPRAKRFYLLPKIHKPLDK